MLSLSDLSVSSGRRREAWRPNLERLLLRLRPGRSIELFIVFDLLGISVLPAAANVCEGRSSGTITAVLK